MLMGLMQDRPLLVSSILEYAARYHGQREIVSRAVDGGIHRTNYAQAAGRARRLAAALIALAVGPGDRVGSLGWNTWAHFELFYAVMGAGCVMHTVNPRLFEDQIAYIVDHGQDRLLFVDSTFLPLAEALLPRLPSVEAVVLFGNTAPAPTIAGRPLLASEDLIAAHAPIPAWPEFAERTACGLCYTSGTTGEPKGVLYSHRSTVLHTLGVCQASAMGLSADDAIIAIAPMYHANAWGIPFSAAMTGAKLILPGPRHDPEAIVGLIRDEGATFACGVPTVWTTVLDHLRTHGGGLGCLNRTTIGGSAVSSAMIDALAAHGVRVLHLWGMTEMSPLGTVATSTPAVDALPDAERAATLRKQGRAQFLVEMKIVGEDGRELLHDGVTPGALWVRGPWCASAYYRREGEPFLDADGWMPTGDVAKIDVHGYMAITDRAKDIIKSGGEWISTVELENAAASHPAVALVAVIGVPHHRWEERPLMVVQCVGGASVCRDTMHAHLSGRVARWWLPDEVVTVEAMPLTATGKIRKVALREMFARSAHER